MALAPYRKKRHFNLSPEPQGGLSQASGLPIFCVQKHAASHLHYDFRLELDGVLKSWAVPKGPSLDPSVQRLAMQVEDHPYDYHSFEGVIPKGSYGAGTVKLWDQGSYSVECAEGPKQLQAAMRKGLKKGHLSFVLHGKKLKGAFSLLRMPSQGGKNPWLLKKKRDNEDSIPTQIKPMLASLVASVKDSAGWYFEPKLDGYRAIAIISKTVSLLSRNNKSFNSRFPELVRALSHLGHKAVLDGEIVCLDKKGRPQFEYLRNHHENPRGPLRYFVFDLLYLDGHDLRHMPLSQRKQLLEKLALPGPLIQSVAYIQAKGSRLLATMRSQGMEGMIAKNASSTYAEGERGVDWLKVKLLQQQEAVVCGYTEGRNSRHGFGALILGLYKGKNLIYVGHTGTGLDSRALKDILRQMQPLHQASSPFQTTPATNAAAHWLKPRLVAQVKFQEWTEAGHMRMPVFLGLRDDKDPKDCKREAALPAVALQAYNGLDSGGSQPFEAATPGRYFGPGPGAKGAESARVGGKMLKLTHLSKTYWPKEGISKGDVIAYYRRMSRWILPYLKDRPQSLNRHPDGIEGENFFHKDFDPKPYAWMKTASIPSGPHGSIHYLICNDEATLAAMANLGCIEINPWNSRLQTLDKPDYAILDFDPEAIPFSKVIEAALQTHRILASSQIPHYVKTTGSRGLHLLIPLGAKYSYEQARLFSQLIAGLVHARLPKTTSLIRQPKLRQKKVYLDCLQNSRGQTLAAPYCLRPKPGALVSTPLQLSELKQGLDPKAFNIHTIEKRLEKVGDLWKPVLGKGIDLMAALKKLEKAGG